MINKELPKPKFIPEQIVIALYQNRFILGVINDGEYKEEWEYTIMPKGYTVKEKDIISV